MQAKYTRILVEDTVFVYRNSLYLRIILIIFKNKFYLSSSISLLVTYIMQKNIEYL